MKKYFSLLVLFLLLTSCAPAAPTTAAISPIVANTVSPADKFATALASDSATKAAGPTDTPTPTPAPTLTPMPTPIGGYPTLSADSSWWKDAVFYEVFVRSFKDSNGDGKATFKD
jgi:hypothetical protein